MANGPGATPIQASKLPLNDNSGPWFLQPGIHQIQVEIPPESVAALRNDPRNYVRATVVEGTERLVNVGLRVKGRTGSFRPIDEKPSLTLAFDHFVHGQQLRGNRKIHLNNSVEDTSYLHEKLGAEVFTAAGIPAPRTAHALLTLNGRRAGLYVVKEGFTPEFLARSFGRGDGDLYEPEPGPGCDVDGPMKRDRGEATQDEPKLSALAAAISDSDPDQRWTRLGRVLDSDAFITFMAVEVLLGHRDGYAQARNNYRLYQNPQTSRFHFIPTGMDRLLRRSDATLRPRFSGSVAKAVGEMPAGRVAYEHRLGVVCTNVLRCRNWAGQITAWADGLARDPALTRQESKELRSQAEELAERFQTRLAFIEKSLAQPELKPLAFREGTARLEGWESRDVPVGGRMDATSLDGRKVLTIVAGPRTFATWRTTALLDAGQYRFEAAVRTRGITTLPDGRNHGVRLTVAAAKSGGANSVAPKTNPARSISSDVDWALLQAEFDIRNGPVLVEFSCGLRAAGGQAWFAVDSLRVVRRGEGRQ